MNQLQAVGLHQRLHFSVRQAVFHLFGHGLVGKGHHPAALGLLAEGRGVRQVQTLLGQLPAQRLGHLHIHKKGGQPVASVVLKCPLHTVLSGSSRPGLNDLQPGRFHCFHLIASCSEQTGPYARRLLFYALLSAERKARPAFVFVYSQNADFHTLICAKEHCPFAC